MNIEKVKNLLEQHAQECLELSSKITYDGDVDLDSQEKTLIRMAILPAVRGAFEIGLINYLISGSTYTMMEAIGENLKAAGYEDKE